MFVSSISVEVFVFDRLLTLRLSKGSTGLGVRNVRNLSEEVNGPEVPPFRKGTRPSCPKEN